MPPFRNPQSAFLQPTCPFLLLDSSTFLFPVPSSLFPSSIRADHNRTPFAHRYDLPHDRSRLGCEAIRGGRSSPRLARSTAWEEADRDGHGTRHIDAKFGCFDALLAFGSIS